MSNDDEDPDVLISKSEKLDEHDYRSETDEDDYVSMILYKAPNGTHFRYIEMSGINSPWVGALGVVEWLDDASVETWNEG